LGNREGFALNDKVALSPTPVAGLSQPRPRPVVFTPNRRDRATDDLNLSFRSRVLYRPEELMPPPQSELPTRQEIRKSLRDCVPYIDEEAFLDTRIEELSMLTIHARRRLEVAEESLFKIRQLRKAVETHFFARLKQEDWKGLHDGSGWKRSSKEQLHAIPPRPTPIWKPLDDALEYSEDEIIILATPSSSPKTGSAPADSRKRGAFEELCAEGATKRMRL
jgi:hypothetical protein